MDNANCLFANIDKAEADVNAFSVPICPDFVFISRLRLTIWIIGNLASSYPMPCRRIAR